MSKIISNINKFESQLKRSKLSKDTIKNYLSDTNHFKAWVTDNNIKSLNKQNILKYIAYLKMKRVSDSSINRKLATLRRLAKFLDENFMSDIKNAGLTNRFTQKIDEYDQKTQSLTTSYAAIFAMLLIVVATTNYLSSKYSGTLSNQNSNTPVLGENITLDRNELDFIPKDSIVSGKVFLTELPKGDQELLFRLSANQTDETDSYYYINQDEMEKISINSSVGGRIILAAGTTETTIYHPQINKDSKIIITPQGSTGNNVLYISLVNEGRFMINSDNPLPKGVIVNWIAN